MKATAIGWVVVDVNEYRLKKELRSTVTSPSISSLKPASCLKLGHLVA